MQGESGGNLNLESDCSGNLKLKPDQVRFSCSRIIISATQLARKTVRRAREKLSTEPEPRTEPRPSPAEPRLGLGWPAHGSLTGLFLLLRLPDTFVAPPSMFQTFTKLVLGTFDDGPNHASIYLICFNGSAQF